VADPSQEPSTGSPTTDSPERDPQSLDRVDARSLHPALTVVGAMVAGLCICFALPPWGWWPLAPIGIALWLTLLGGRSRRQRAGIGWLIGVAWFGPSTLWMAALTLPGYVVGTLVAWGGMVAAVCALCPADRRRLVALPALLVMFEWFHTHAPFGGIPLSLLATSQTNAPLLPVARLGGVLLLGLAVSTCGTVIHLAATRRAGAAAAAIAAVAVVALGGVAWPLGEPVAHVRLVGVQGGGPQGTTYSSGQAPVVFGRHLEATRAFDGPVDVMVWPENVVNMSGVFTVSPELRLIAGEANRLDAPIVVGVVESVDTAHFVNYVVVVHPDGTVTDRFDKKRRVPFGEYVPMRWLFEPIAGATLPSRDQVPGTTDAVIRTGHGKMAVVISWEVFFGRRVREGVRAGGQVVLNPTNGSSYWLTQVQTQQIAASQLRAVESGRWLLQVSPTGFSAFVDPAGGVHERTDVSETKVIARTVPRYDTTTPAQALGDLPGVLLAAAALAWTYLVEPRRHRDGTDDATDPDGDRAETVTPPA